MSCLLSLFANTACSQFPFLALIFLCSFMQEEAHNTCCTPACKGTVKHSCYNSSSSLTVQLTFVTPVYSGMKKKIVPKRRKYISVKLNGYVVLVV